MLEPIESAPETLHVKNGDSFLWVRLGAYGGAHYMPEIQPAVYRAHAGGIWSGRSHSDKRRTLLNTYLWMGMYHARTGRPDLAKYFADRINEMVKGPFEVYPVVKRRAYQWFVRVMGWFGVSMPRG